jgi:hypothetical protein
MLRFYRLINVLSLDVAIGAVICAAFFAKILEVGVWPTGLTCLGLSVWLIYTADHLIDGYGLKGEASTQRHRFHQKYFSPLVIIFLFILVIDITLVMFIRKDLFTGGLILASLVVVYFLVQRWLYFLKELVGSLLYTAGVLLPMWSFYPGKFSLFVTGLCGLLFLTAFINMILFSLFDHEYDLSHRHNSIVTSFGARNTRKLLPLLFALVLSLAVYLLFLEPYRWKQVLIMLTMPVLLLIIFLTPGWFLQWDRYRLVGDAVFLIPIVIFM